MMRFGAPGRGWAGVLAISLMLASGLVSAQAPNTASTAATIDVPFGAILSLTGSGAQFGEWHSKGVSIAVEDANKSFQAKNIPLRIRALIEDHQGIAQPAVTAMNKLVEVNKVPFVALTFTSPTLAVAPTADNRQVLVINGGGTGPKLAGAGKFVFHSLPLSTYEAVAMANYAYKELGIRRAAIFHLTDDLGTGVADAFEKAFKSLGGTIVARESHEPAATDMTSQLAKLRSAKPEAVYLATHGDTLNLFLRAAANQNFKPQWLSYFAYPNPNMAKVAGTTGNGAYYTSPRFDIKSNDPAVAAFRTTYHHKYGAEPEILASAMYDTVRIFASLLEGLWNAGVRPPYSGAQLRDQLLKTNNFHGVTGSMTFSPTDGTVKKSLFILKWGGESGAMVKDLPPQT